MNKTLLKIFPTFIATLFALFVAIIHQSCDEIAEQVEDSLTGDTDEGTLEQDVLYFISIKTSDDIITGTINTSNKVISFSGITDLSSIEKISYSLKPNITITPSFESITTWENNLEFTFKNSTSSTVYTVNFPDYKNDILSSSVIESISFSTTDGILKADINHENKEILVYDISSAIVTGVSEYVLAKNTTVSPSFESITSWKAEMTFSFSRYGTITNYTLIFPDEVVISYDDNSANVLKMSIEEANRQQRILFIGTDIERSQGFIPKASNFDEVIQWGFGDTGFDVCRVSYDKKQELTEGEPDMSFYDGAIETMQAIKAVNPDIEFWSCMKSDYNGYNNQNNLPDWICDYNPNTSFEPKKYARFLADYLKHMEDNGVPIRYLSTSKEWTAVITASRARKIIMYLKDYIEDYGITEPLFVDACTWSTSQGYTYVKNILEEGCESYYYGFSTHNYNSSSSNPYQYEKMVDKVNSITTLNSVGEPFYSFADETSGGGFSSSGVNKTDLSKYTGNYIERTEFYADGINAELIFEFYSRGYDNETRTIYIPSTGDKIGHRMNYYYIHQAHGTFLEKDMYYYRTTNQNFDDKVYTMAFAHDKRAYVCVVNDEDSFGIDDFILDLNNEAINGTVEYRIMDTEVVCNQGQEEGTVGFTKMNKGKLQMDLPAESLSFFLIELD